MMELRLTGAINIPHEPTLRELGEEVLAPNERNERNERISGIWRLQFVIIREIRV
jgi:phosphohistidine phosphatase SixA